MSQPAGQRGFTYVWALASVAIVGVGLAAIGPLWAHDARRDREQDLLRIGNEYARAIASYYVASPLTGRQFPKTLDDLVEDARTGIVRRHLRRLYRDPVDPELAWGLIHGPDGTIRGVYSRSADAPVRVEALTVGNTELPAANHYYEWKFIAKVGS